MKKLNIILIFAIISFFVYLFYVDRYLKPKELMNNGILIKARTTEWVTGAKGSVNLKYNFVFNEKIIYSFTPVKNNRGNQHFVNKYFYVLYSPKTGNKDLLMTPNDFKKYNLSFPDSLKWVLEYAPNGTD